MRDFLPDEIEGPVDEALAEIGGNKVESSLTEVKVDGDKVSFIETLKFQDNELKIAYSGTVSGNEMKLVREVGEVAKEDVVAKRQAPAAAPAPLPAPASEHAADAAYIASGSNLYNGLSSVIAGYAQSQDTIKKQIYEIWQTASA